MGKKRPRGSPAQKKVETDQKSDGESDDRPAPVRYSEDEPEAKKVRYENRTSNWLHIDLMLVLNKCCSHVFSNLVKSF